jgi:hypothetical protein
MDTSGDSLKHAWPVVIGIINDAMTAANPLPNATTIRIAFDSIRMVVTDFLPTVPLPCYPLLMDTIARFGQQNVDVNICLSAIGLLWNVSDFLSRHIPKIQTDLAVLSETEGDSATDINESSLWMGLFEKLALLCIDPRSEVRKSANQTLFSTITTHGNRLQPETWRRFLSEILSPLLDNVNAAFKAAEGASAPQDQPGFMVHHSRNTAAKQWDETRIMALGGVSKVFASFHRVLMTLDQFASRWSELLQHIQIAGGQASEEVSKAAILALQEICRSPTEIELATPVEGGGACSVPPACMPELWASAWQVWLCMAKEVIDREPRPSVSHLALFVECFPLLYKHIKSFFAESDATRMLAAIRDIADLQHHEALSSSTMTTVQDHTIQAVLSLLPNDRAEPAHTLVPMVLKELAIYASLGCDPPPPPPPLAEGAKRKKPRTGACVPMALAAMDKLSLLYTRYCDLPEVVSGQVVLVILDVLKVPMSRKYLCPLLSLWRRGVHTFVSIVTAAVRGGELHASLASTDPAAASIAKALCGHIVAVLDSALFSEVQQPAELSAEEREADAALDVELVHLIRDVLLPAGAAESSSGGESSVPQTEYTESLYGLLQRGTMNTQDHGGPESPTRRSTFARMSFQTLLDKALASSGGEPGETLGASMEALLATSRNTLGRYVEDDEGTTPLPKERTNDAVFVLEAISPMITPERKMLAVELYPLFVQLVSCHAPELKEPLQQLLQKFLHLF